MFLPVGQGCSFEGSEMRGLVGFQPDHPMLVLYNGPLDVFEL